MREGGGGGGVKCVLQIKGGQMRERRGVCVKRHSFERLKRMCLQCTHWPIIEYSKMYSSR